MNICCSTSNTFCLNANFYLRFYSTNSADYFCKLSFFCISLIRRQCDGRQNTYDGHYDHQFDQGKALSTLVEFDTFHLLSPLLPS